MILARHAHRPAALSLPLWLCIDEQASALISLPHTRHIWTTKLSNCAKSSQNALARNEKCALNCVQTRAAAQQQESKAFKMHIMDFVERIINQMFVIIGFALCITHALAVAVVLHCSVNQLAKFDMHVHFLLWIIHGRSSVVEQSNCNLREKYYLFARAKKHNITVWAAALLLLLRIHGIYAIEMMVQSGGRLACGCIAIWYYQNDGKNHGRPAATNGTQTTVLQTFQQTAN